MEKVEFLKLGAFCLERMSLKAQKELLRLAENGVSFTGPVLSELNGIEKGYDFVKACGGRLDLTGFMDILIFCGQPAIDRIITDKERKDAFLKSREIEGYFIRENESVYHTLDMDATIRWFKTVLGWPGVIEAKDEAGNGTYGLITPHDNTNAAQTRGLYIQLWRGEPVKSVVGYMGVWGLNNLRQCIIDNGWKQVTPVEKKDWGASAFDMTTCDGSLLRFYEPDQIST